MNLLNPMAPSQILVSEFMYPEEISIEKLAINIGMKFSDIDDMCNGKKPFSDDFCYRISNYFGNSFKFWKNLQRQYDEEVETLVLLEKALTLVTHINKSTESITVHSFDFSKDNDKVFETNAGYKLILKVGNFRSEIFEACIISNCLYFKVNSDFNEFVLFQNGIAIEVYEINKIGEF